MLQVRKKEYESVMFVRIRGAEDEVFGGSRLQDEVLAAVGLRADDTTRRHCT